MCAARNCGGVVLPSGMRSLQTRMARHAAERLPGASPCGGSLNVVAPAAAQHSIAADCLQPPLRCGLRQLLKAGVDMTSDVKGWEQLFYVCLIFSLLSIGRAGASKTRRLITLISVGWLPPYLHPSEACLNRGTRVPVGLITPPRVTPNRGCVSSDRRWKP
jgi:hypothetical protein